jgi:phosphate transport system protein
MTRTRFHQGLEDLKQRLLIMGGLAEQAVDRAIHAYVTRDVEISQKVLEDEKTINVSEREIDEQAVDLLAMQQPMAVDLRFLFSVIKINADLERVGDQAVNIAERVIDMSKLPASDLPVDIARMASIAAAMVHQSLQAFIEENAELAQEVLERDDVVDDINREAFESLTRVMTNNPELTRQALDALIVARNLERVADHATNIAEDVIFWVRGADVRHHGVSNPAAT